VDPVDPDSDSDPDPQHWLNQNCCPTLPYKFPKIVLIVPLSVSAGRLMSRRSGGTSWRRPTSISTPGWSSRSQKKLFIADPDPKFFITSGSDPKLGQLHTVRCKDERTMFPRLYRNTGMQPVLRIRIRDLVLFLPRNPGWKKNPDPGQAPRIMFADPGSGAFLTQDVG
jgi:hypothetical protein